MNPYISVAGDEAFIFFNTKYDNRPMHGEYVTNCLYRTMAKIGISEKERKERNITFHSWRYFLNSLLINSKIPIQKIQFLTIDFFSD